MSLIEKSGSKPIPKVRYVYEKIWERVDQFVVRSRGGPLFKVDRMVYDDIEEVVISRGNNLVFEFLM